MANSMPAPPSQINPPLVPASPGAKSEEKPKSIARYFTLPSKSAKSEAAAKEGTSTRKSRTATGGKLSASEPKKSKPVEKVAEQPKSAPGSSTSWMGGWWK
jgi:hypothetical protein